MALRTFHFNPSLGGFGGDESLLDVTSTSSPKATPDAFCQIIKELVDNAVDACYPTDTMGPENESSDNKSKNSYRVRVVIEKFHGENGPIEESPTGFEVDENSSEILRVTVSDNGCGMEDIEKCVGAFHTSKAHSRIQNNKQTEIAGNEKRKPKRSDLAPSLDDKGKSVWLQAARSDENKVLLPCPESITGSHTSGRYGIGLTLCLLHAQRLIPNSCAAIKSATARQKNWTNVLCIVDTARDSIRCICQKEYQLDSEFNKSNVVAKSFQSESGTSISVLVPGGRTAHIAWPRLAEYFARFKLSLHLPCSLEVLAPTLSRVPLLVLPRSLKQDFKTSEVHKDRISNSNKKIHAQNDDEERIAVWKAAERFLGRQIDFKSVAHCKIPIRCKRSKNSPNTTNWQECSNQKSTMQPMFRVSLVVQGLQDDDIDSCKGSNCNIDDIVEDDNVISQHSFNNSSANMVLIRMVNNVPLLDSSEALACGLVQGLASKKSIWNSFGLEVKQRPITADHCADGSKTPQFEVHDSEQVSPFFRISTHSLLKNAVRHFFEQEHDSMIYNEHEDEQQEIPEEFQKVPNDCKRKRQSEDRPMHPASLRLGDMLMIFHIHADPSNLPLPTLSKGCIPMDILSIDNAIEQGIQGCLKQLQVTHPGLLLTAVELRKAERDSRYVPASAAALSTIISKSSFVNQETRHIISAWDDKNSTSVNTKPIFCSHDGKNITENSGYNATLTLEEIQILGTKLEDRLAKTLLLSSRRLRSNKNREDNDINDASKRDLLSQPPNDLTASTSDQKRESFEIDHKTMTMKVTPESDKSLASRNRMRLLDNKDDDDSNATHEIHGSTIPRSDTINVKIARNRTNVCTRKDSRKYENWI